jgi:hypothetical protein
MNMGGDDWDGRWIGRRRKDSIGLEYWEGRTEGEEDRLEGGGLIRKMRGDKIRYNIR